MAVDRVYETFLSGQQPVAVDIFQLAQGRYPAIVLLHGGTGLDNDASRPYHRFASFLAESGYIVFLVHYFDGTDVKIADKKAINKYFVKWAKTAFDAITFASQRSNVLADRIGLLGTSLGASVAVSLATLRPGIGAVAELFGTLPAFAEPLSESLPPTLIIHGEKDRLVPVKEAYKLAEVLRSHNVPYEIKVYQEEGHIFRAAAAIDSAELTVKFFNKYLQRSSVDDDASPPRADEKL